MSNKDDSSYDLAPATPPSARPAPRPDVAPAGIPVAPAQPIQERPCPHCGFRIVGKPRNNRCPDCSAPLDQTATDLLQFSTPAWTRAVSWGAIVVVVAIMAHVAGSVVQFRGFQSEGAKALHAGAAALVFVGVCMTTVREKLQGAKRSPLAILSRLLALAAIGFWGLAIAKTSMQNFAHCAALVVDMVLGFTFCYFAAGLSMRVPNDGLVQHFRILPYALVLVFAGLLFSAVVPSDDMWYLREMFFCSIPLVAAMAGILLWLAITLLRFAIELRRTAAAAEEIVERRIRRSAPRPPAK